MRSISKCTFMPMCQYRVYTIAYINMCFWVDMTTDLWCLTLDTWPSLTLDPWRLAFYHKFVHFVNDPPIPQLWSSSPVTFRLWLLSKEILAFTCEICILTFNLWLLIFDLIFLKYDTFTLTLDARPFIVVPGPLTPNLWTLMLGLWPQILHICHFTFNPWRLNFVPCS